MWAIQVIGEAEKSNLDKVLNVYNYFYDKHLSMYLTTTSDNAIINALLAMRDLKKTGLSFNILELNHTSHFRNSSL